MPFAVTSAGRVFYEERGSGLPVVLLHATLHDRRDFDLVVGPLAERYRTIAVDWPGHGQSDPGGQAVDAFLLAKVLAELVEGLDLPPAVLIGNSVGGFAAARLAINRPETVAGLVLVNNGGFLPMNPLLRMFCRTLGTPAVQRTVGAPFIRGYMKAKTDNDRAIIERAVAAVKTDEGIRVVTGLWRSFATPGHDLRDRAAELTAPTLIVWGKKDIAPLRAGRATHESIRDSRFEVFDTGHVVFSSDPDRFLAAVEPFLESVVRRV